MEEFFSDAERRMKHAIEVMVHDFSTIRTGRASPLVLERVHVEYYGTETPINQIASVSTPDPRQLLISPYEKNMIPVIEKAILKSDLGITPTSDSAGIRLNFPQMTEERRKELVKQVNARAEQAIIAIRNVRRDANEHAKKQQKDQHLSEDDLKSFETKIQKLTDKMVEEAHGAQKKKEAELMEV
ncbi:MAG: ribosome recycling factor [Chthonomonas sp.]|nr:ribosome recycling factor [Chthonomonas sp.]